MASSIIHLSKEIYIERAIKATVRAIGISTMISTRAIIIPASEHLAVGSRVAR